MSSRKSSDAILASRTTGTNLHSMLTSKKHEETGVGKDMQCFCSIYCVFRHNDDYGYHNGELRVDRTQSLFNPIHYRVLALRLPPLGDGRVASLLGFAVLRGVER